jgi:adenine-specific DNA methylase
MAENKGKENNACPRLIEVALPIREISVESVRDKNIHHAHISHLHIWWARRPLAASRAVVFASLVPDPDDPLCSAEFRAAVERLLKTHVPAELKYYRRGRETYRDEDPYCPYDGIEDTLRNRLLMFIAKWSPESLAYEAGKRKDAAAPKDLLDDRSLVKWETSDPENVQGVEVLRIARALINLANGGMTPKVLDPFAGGGAIPLEAGRLGCQAIANDYNPVAYLILRATCDFPQKYGMPGKRKVVIEEFGKNVERETEVPNILVYDLERWANWILERVRAKIAPLYPAGKDGKPVVGYLWARTAPCSNPSCRGEIPLLRSFLVCNKKEKKIALTMDVDKKLKSTHFGIAEGNAIKTTEGTMQNRGNTLCPFCEQVTPVADLRRAGLSGRMGEQMVAVITDDEHGKSYRPVEEIDRQAFRAALEIQAEQPQELILPEVNAEDAADDVSNSTGIRVHLYGMRTWGSLFNPRQLVAIQTFVECLHEASKAIVFEVANDGYRKALETYLGLWLDRIACFNTSVCRWAAGSEISKTPFSGQAIPMIWDYPEVNPLADSSGTASTQLRYMLKVIGHERIANHSTFAEPSILLGNAASLPLESGISDYVVTDPPYDDAISYADLSDFFYVWLKRSIGSLFPNVFSTPLTPKAEEATSLKHRHEGSQERARAHYQRLLKESFSEALRLVREPKLVTVMFAHQSTDAWTALISALFDAGLSPDATWPIATEMPNTALALGTALLETSVTVACRPRVVGSAVSFKTVRVEIEKEVSRSVKRFWSYGIRGADLIVACYGPAVGVFGRYERVEKADGTVVGIPELLELAKQAARDAIAGEFRGDNLSTLYYVWANLYGAAEQAWDDARLVVQIGGDEDNAMEVARGHGIFVVDGAKCRLALLGDRADRRGLGIDLNCPLIDALHRSMLQWKEEKRKDLVNYLAERDLMEDGPFWKLAQALFEVLPRDSEDWRLVTALLGERQTLRTEGRRKKYKEAQRGLPFDDGGEKRS